MSGPLSGANSYGLVAKLKALEPEITKAKRLKAAATKPGDLTAARAKK